MDIKEAAKATKKKMLEPMIQYNPNNKDGLSKSHIVWMLDGIILGYITGDKSHRWLGWAQAVVCAYDDATLEDLKEINFKA